MVGIYRTIGKGIDGVITGTGFLGVVIVLALSVFIIPVILARFFPVINIPGFFDAALYSLIIFPFATVAYTLSRKKHIVVDVLVERLPERARSALEIATYLTCLVFVVILTWKAVEWAMMLIPRGTLTEGVWTIPKGLLVGLIAFGAFLLILQIIKIIIGNIGSLATAAGTTDSAGLRDRPLFAVFVYVVLAGLGLLGFIYVSPVASLVFLLLLFLFAGMPVFLAMGVLGGMGVFLVIGESALMQLPLKAVDAMSSFPLTCLPLFVLGGLIIEGGKIADDLFQFFAI